ncbi:MAG: ArsR/SmtB family transcription factor [Candidatus Heimdallarchaeaceae archaeon]
MTKEETSKVELEEKLSALFEQQIISGETKERIRELEKLSEEVKKLRKNRQMNSYLKLFKALGNENRLLMLWLIMNGVRCACELEYLLGLSQSTVSHHLNELIDAGVIDVIRSGKWSLISIESKIMNKEFFKELIEKLD